MNPPNKYIPLPADTDSLIEQLDAAFPPRCPGIKQSEREIWMYAGKRALVEHLLARREEDREATTENDFHVFS